MSDHVRTYRKDIDALESGLYLNQIWKIILILYKELPGGGQWSRETR